MQLHITTFELSQLEIFHSMGLATHSHSPVSVQFSSFLIWNSHIHDTLYMPSTLRLFITTTAPFPYVLTAILFYLRSLFSFTVFYFSSFHKILTRNGNKASWEIFCFYSHKNVCVKKNFSLTTWWGNCILTEIRL